jgi:hypothetical protein
MERLRVVLVDAAKASGETNESSHSASSEKTKYYNVRVSDAADPKGAPHCVRKRYTDFEDLHRRLSQMPSISKVLPDMPGKSFFRKTFNPNGKHMKQRQETLAKILETASSHPEAQSALQEFVASSSDLVVKSLQTDDGSNLAARKAIVPPAREEVTSPDAPAPVQDNLLSVTEEVTTEGAPPPASETKEAETQEPDGTISEYCARVLSACPADLEAALRALEPDSRGRLEQCIEQMCQQTRDEESMPPVTEEVTTEEVPPTVLETEEAKSQEPVDTLSDYSARVLSTSPSDLEAALRTAEPDTRARLEQCIAQMTQQTPDEDVKAMQLEVVSSGELDIIQAAEAEALARAELAHAQRMAEEETISTPPPKSDTSSLGTPEKTCQQPLDTEDDPGMYEIMFECFVTEEKSPSSKVTCEQLAPGSNVNVLEVVLLKDEQRLIRGRIESPIGWISLADTNTGVRWARKQADSEPEIDELPIVRNLINFEECRKEMDIARSTRDGGKRGSRRSWCCSRKEKEA